MHSVHKKIFIKDRKEKVKTSSYKYNVDEEQINDEKLQSVSPDLNSSDLKMVPKAEFLHDKS